MGNKLAPDTFASFGVEGAQKVTSEDFEYLGRTKPQKTPSFLDELGATARARAGDVASIGAAATDMLIGAPASLMQKGHELAAYGIGRWEGLPVEEAWKLGKEIPLMPAWSMTPATEALKAAGGKEWSTEGLSHAMEKGTEAVGKATGASPGALLWGLETGMAAGGVGGLKAAAGAMKAKPGQGWENVSPEARAVERAGEAPVETPPPVPGEAPFRQVMPDVLTRAERVKRTTASAERVKEAFKRDPETADYMKYKVEEGREANAQELVAQAMKEGRQYTKPEYDALLERARQAQAKPAFLQTAADKLDIRAALREQAIDYAKMGKFGELGKADPELLRAIVGVVGGLTLGAAAGKALFEFFGDELIDRFGSPEKIQERDEERSLQEDIEAAERRRGYPLTDEEKDTLRKSPGARRFFNPEKYENKAPEKRTLNEALTLGGLLAGTALSQRGGSAMGVLRESMPYGSKVFDRLAPNKIEYGKQEVQQVLNQADIVKADKEVFKRILDETSSDRIAANALVEKFQLETGSHTLEPKDVVQYAGYGNERIGRTADTAMTTLWKLPEHMEMDQANHFHEPRLFGHTRAFSEEGVRHVVEVQSDLMQHVKVISPERYKELSVEYQKLVDEDAKLWSVLNKIQQAGVHYTSTVADGIATAAGFKSGKEAFNRAETIALRREEIKVNLQGTAAGSQLGEFKQTWPRRLVREELMREARAAQGDTSVMRFATADTMTKVEGWPRDPVPYSLWNEFPKGKLKPEYQGIYDRHKRDVEGYVKQLGGKEVTDAQGHTWIEVPLPKRGPVQMYGRADPQTLITISGLGLGAITGSLVSDDPLYGGLTGSLIGAALTLPGVRERLGSAVKGIDYLGGMISTRLLNKAPELYKVMHDLDRGEMTRAGGYLTRAVPWLKESVNLSKEQKALLNTGIFLKDAKALAEVHQGNPALVAAWREVQNLLRETGEAAKGLGRFKNLSEDYFPQRVKDYKGLMKHLDAPIRTRLETLIKDAEAKAARRGSVFTETERDALINNELRNTYKPSSHMPAYAKTRKIQEVTAELQRFYHTPQTALAMTLTEVARDLELAKAFGKDLVQSKHEGKLYTNIEQSVGNVVGRLISEKKLDAAAQHEIESLLRARLGPGERSPNKVLTEVQALGYMATLGDVVATVVQIGDPLKVAYTQGPRATMTAIARKLSRRNHITPEEFHLSDHIAQELAAGSDVTVPLKRRQQAVVGAGAGVGALLGWEQSNDLWGAAVGAMAGSYISLVGVAGAAGALNKLMRHQGFAKLDLFGKGVALEAALIRHQRLAQTETGRADITRRYAEVYGKEFPQLLEDLKGKKITEPVRALAWMELAREQPISKMERSQAFLENPNARGLWMLKNWMAKQFDIVRRDAFGELRKGDKASVARGLRNLTAFSFVLGLSGVPGSMIKDWMMGREVDFEATDVAENVLKTFGFSEYTRQKLSEGKKLDTFLGTFAPPWQIMDRIVEQDPKAVAHIPILGRLYEAHELGGKERYEIMQRSQKAKELKEQFGRPLTPAERKQFLPPLSPSAKLYQQQLKEQRNGTR